MTDRLNCGGCRDRLPCHALLAHVLDTIRRWPDQLAEARAAKDPGRALTHLCLNMLQVAETLERLMEYDLDRPGGAGGEDRGAGRVREVARPARAASPVVER